jgi:hypothetical protein
MDRLMDEITLKGMLENEIDNALGYLDTETTEQRRQAIKSYNRDPYGNEVEGRSQIVTGEVAEAIDGAIPQLLRIFTQSDDVVRFEPKGPGDEEKSKQATEYCNWVLMSENPGVTILHDWIKDALIYKNGVIKVWWEDMTEVNSETYENLSQDELTLLLSDGQYEIVSQEEIKIGEVPAPAPSFIPGQAAQMAENLEAPPMVPVYAYNVKIKKVDKKGRVVIENLAPEEFIVSKKTRQLAESPFCAHRRLVTRSELVAMGFSKKIVEDLPTYNDLEYTTERVARFSNGEQPDDPSLDPSMQEIEVYEAYMKVDYDGDGIAELRRIVYAGHEVLENEETDYVPFCSICPIPMPHKFYGHSLADRATDLQLIKTTITRQILDNLYLSNNARMMVVDGQVNLDDMLTVTPGGVVRVKNPQAVTPLTVPLVAGQAFPMLDYMDQIQQKRTGVTQASQGLDPNILQNTTATAVAMVQNAGAARVELIARLFAETGVKDLFRNILHLVCKYQDKERIIRLRGKFVSIDPREWSNEYDLSINVGLGTGSKEQQMAMIAMVLDKQERIIQQYGPANPLVSVGQYRQTLGKLIEAAGFKDSTEFFREITPEMDAQLSSPPPQQQQPDPMVQALMAQTQAQIQAMMAKAEADIQVKQEKAMADIALAQEKAAAEIALKRQELAAQTSIDATAAGIRAVRGA